MAGFEGIKWAAKQLRYKLKDKSFEIMDADAKVPAEIGRASCRERV